MCGFILLQTEQWLKLKPCAQIMMPVINLMYD